MNSWHPSQLRNKGLENLDMRMLQGQCICQSVCSSAYQSFVFQIPPVDEARGYGRGMLSPDYLDFAKYASSLSPAVVYLFKCSSGSIWNLKFPLKCIPHTPKQMCKDVCSLKTLLKRFKGSTLSLPISLSETCIIHPSLKRVPWCSD